MRRAIITVGLGFGDEGKGATVDYLAMQIEAGADSDQVEGFSGGGDIDAHLLLTPHRLYVDEVRALRAEADVKALAHVTGGGIAGNLGRVLPPGRSPGRHGRLVRIGCRALCRKQSQMHCVASKVPSRW